MQSAVAAVVREGEESILLTEIWKVISDNATKFKREFQSWWCLANFTYDPINNRATAFVLTTHSASVYTTNPIMASGLNHNRTVLHSWEHRAWPQYTRNKWQTVDISGKQVIRMPVLHETNCESNTIKAQDICLDTEQKDLEFWNTSR